MSSLPTSPGWEWLLWEKFRLGGRAGLLEFTFTGSDFEQVTSPPRRVFFHIWEMGNDRCLCLCL